MARHSRKLVAYLKWSLLTAAAVAVLARPAAAHEKWFMDATTYPLRWNLFFRPQPLAFVGAVSLVTLGAWLLWRARGERGFVPGPESLGASPAGRSILYGVLPLILGIHVAVPLLVSGVQGDLFTPNNALHGAWKYLLGVTETGVALALFYGALTRLAALILVTLWLLGLFVVGVEPMLENLLYLGYAAFFLLAGRGPISIDRLVLPRWGMPARAAAWAVPCLRASLGASFIVVAFTEKFANLPLAEAFLHRFPLNFTGAFGIPFSNELFILCAGAVELTIGLWLLFGLFPREVILLAWIPLNLTLTYFDWTELIGHLPIYAVLAVMLLWVPDGENRQLWLKGLQGRPLIVPEPPARHSDERKVTPSGDVIVNLNH
jgi:uncharacterized membrane protein YphA (DoxX/SURF4 family)